MMVEQASNFLNRLRQRWHRALSKRRAINELAACPPGELRRIASEVGLNGNDLVRLSCSHSGPSELLPRRLNLLGIDPDLSGMRTMTLRDFARLRGLQGIAPLRARFGSRQRSGRHGYLCLNGPAIAALTERDGGAAGPRWNRSAACIHR